jgi:hypothetical protein
MKLGGEGMALIMVLWVLTLLSVLVLEFCFTMRTEVNISWTFWTSLVSRVTNLPTGFCRKTRPGGPGDFFSVHDPTTLNRQGADVGTQYRSAIFYHTPEQKAVAEQVIKEFEAGHLDPKLLEILCCDGCVMGPGMTVQTSTEVGRF